MEIESKDPNSDSFEFHPPTSSQNNTILMNSNYDQPQDELSTSNHLLLDKSHSHQQNEIPEAENIQNHSLERFKLPSGLQHEESISKEEKSFPSHETIEVEYPKPLLKNENNQPLSFTEDLHEQQIMVIEETQSKGYYRDNSLNTIIESVNEQTYNRTDETSVLERSSIVQNIAQGFAVLPTFQDENQINTANIETPKPTITSSTRKGLTNITNNFDHVSENKLKNLNEEIAADILKPQDIKTNRPLRPYSLNALEEGRHEPFELQQRHVLTDERPIKSRGVYSRAETEIFTPIKRDRNSHGSGKKHDSGRALLSALGLQSSNKGKGADEERPSASRKSFILNSEERPILGMDVYNDTVEESEPVYQVPEKQIVVEEKSIREEQEENTEMIEEKPTSGGKKDLLESIQENLAAEKEETEMIIEEKPVVTMTNPRTSCLSDERPIRPARQSLEPLPMENLSKNSDEPQLQDQQRSIRQSLEPLPMENLSKTSDEPQLQDQQRSMRQSLEPVPEDLSKNTDETQIPMMNPRTSSCLSDERPIRAIRQSSLEPSFPENLSNKLFQENPNLEEEAQPQSLPNPNQPLNERVKSKIWKVRQLAYEELANLFNRDSPNESIFQEYAEDMIKFIADANPGAQEKAIEAFKAFAENYEPFKYETRDILKTLIEKALAPGKPSMKKSANEAICSIFEKGGSQAVSDAIIDCFNHKNQKTVCAAVQVIFELLHNKKIKTFALLKPFLAHIEKLAGSSTAPIRTEAIGFYKEAYLYFGRALQPSISKLKKAQQDELQAHFNNSDSIPDKMEIEQKDPKSFENKQQEVDAYDAVEPVDIFKKFDQSWCDRVLDKTKWNEKKALLDDLLKEAVTAIRLANTPHHHIDDLLKRLMADNNITVVATVIKVYTALARGLRRSYNSTCKLAISSILAKLKDKRGQIIDEACKALDSFLFCVTLDEVIEDLKEILKDKAPEVKIHTMSLVEIGCEKYEKMPEKVLTLYKALNQIIKKLVNDSSGEVRESAMRLLALWKAFLGDSVIKDNYNNIPQPKLGKINELAGLLLASEDKTPAVPALELFSTPTVIKTSSFVSDGMEEEETIKTPVNNTKSDPKKLGNSSNGGKPAAGTKRNSLKNLPPVPPMASTKSPEDDIVSYLTLEDAQAKLIELGVPTSALEYINNNAWKEKVTGLSQLNAWIEYNIDLVSPHLEYLFKYLKSKLKDWKESNLNILRETFSIIITTVKNKQAALTKKSFSRLSQLIINNIYDNKYAHQCETIIYSYIEFVNPKSVLLVLLNSLLQDSNKNAKPNPKVLIEMCNLFARLIEELTLKFVPLKEMVDFGKLTISNQNSACRTAATSLFKSLYQQMGPKINDLISDISPQTLKILINEFKQVIPLRDVQCKIQFREDAEIDSKDLASGNALESMPRADISKDVEKNLRKLLDNDWKVRKECLDTLDTIVTLTGCRILPNGLNELVGILKSRLSDNNKSLAKSFIAFIGKLATSLGPDAKVYAKTLLPELIKNLSDKQAAIRQETLSSLNKFSAEIGSTILINHMLPFLSQENPEMRSEILTWILNSNDNLAKADIKQNVAPVLSALQDKTKDIRNLAEKLLERCINVIGTIPYVSILKNLKPATQQLLKPIISKLRAENEIEVESLDTSLDQIQTSKAAKRTPSTLKSSKPSVPKLSLNNNTLNLNNVLGNLNTSIHSAPTPSNHSTPRESLNNLPHYPQNPHLALQNEMEAFDKSGNIICIRGQKDKRREEENVNPWPTNELQDDTLEKLKSQLRAHVCSELHKKMFSIDFRNHLGAIFLLYKALGGEFKGTIDILDLIFKWFFVRLWYNSNPEIIMQSIEYLSHLISSLEHEQYTLFDFEANVLLSCLILKLGTIPQDLKGQLHKLLVKLTSVYSASKVALTLLNGMNYNNPQTRIECIEVLAKIIKTCGADIISYKDLQVFGRLLKHNDINIRLKSLMLLVEAGKHIGDQIITLVGRDAPPSLLEELRSRLQAHQDGNTVDSIHLHEEADSNKPLYNPISPEKSIEIAPPVVEKKVEAPIVVAVKQKSPEPEPKPEKIEKKSEVIVVEKPKSQQQQQQSKPHEEESMIPSHSQKESRRLDEEKFQKGLQILVQGTVSSKLDILVFIHELAISDEEENKRFLRKKANFIFEALRLVLAQVFEKSEDEVPSKFLLYYINMIHKLCSIRLLVKSTSEGYLRDFAEEILIRLLAEDEEKEEADEIKQLNRVENDMLVKTLNSTMLRLLENAEPNDMFCILFDLLIKHRRINSYSKILGLIIKCVLKLTKALEQLVSVIKPEKILLKSHFYLLEFGLDPSKFGEDIGIKTIKTILNELAKIYREKIWEFYSHSIQLHPQQDNYIHRWLTVILKPLVAESNSSSKKNQQGSAESEKNGPASADKYKPFDQGQQQEIPLIREIVDRLKTSGNLGESIRALHEALSQHPNHSLSPYLYNCTKSFTDFVKAELEKLRLQNNSRNNSGTKQDHQNSGNKSQIKVLDGQNVSAEKTFRHANSLDRSPMANIEDLQHKISKLKARYGLIVKDENQNVVNTENEVPKNAPSQDDYNPSGYDFGSALNRNIENQENIPLNGQSQTKSTGGSLLQKLSVSKFKTPSISKSMYTPN